MKYTIRPPAAIRGCSRRSSACRVCSSHACHHTTSIHECQPATADDEASFGVRSGGVGNGVGGTHLDLLEEWGGGNLVGGMEEAVDRGSSIVACAGLHDGAEDLHLVHLAARHERQDVVAQLGDGLGRGRERGGVRAVRSISAVE